MFKIGDQVRATGPSQGMEGMEGVILSDESRFYSYPVYKIRITAHTHLTKHLWPHRSPDFCAKYFELLPEPDLFRASLRDYIAKELHDV